jgi:hypothetical protein
VVVPASMSVALGVNENIEPTWTRVAGVPEIAGGVFGDVTVIANAGSGAEAWPSVTLITILGARRRSSRRACLATRLS